MFPRYIRFNSCDNMPDETPQTIAQPQQPVDPSQQSAPLSPVTPPQPAVPLTATKPKIDTTTLSPIERSIYLDAGENGVLLFRMANGKITIADAMLKLGLDDAAMDTLVAKLSGKYLFIEAESESKKEEVKIERKEQGIIPIDVPKRSAESKNSLTLGSEITIRFGPSGKRIFDLIDGKLDVVQLAADTMVTLSYADDLMWFLSEKRVLTFTRLKEEDVRNRYGNIGMSIFNQYGREGIFLYLLLDKTSDPTAAIRASEIDPSKAVDMMEFILKQINTPISFNKKDVLTMLKR